MWKYVWVKKCIEIREMLFKNWKWLFENTNQTPLCVEAVFSHAMWCNFIWTCIQPHRLNFWFKIIWISTQMRPKLVSNHMGWAFAQYPLYFSSWAHGPQLFSPLRNGSRSNFNYIINGLMVHIISSLHRLDSYWTLSFYIYIYIYIFLDWVYGRNFTEWGQGMHVSCILFRSYLYNGIPQLVLIFIQNVFEEKCPITN